MLKNHINQNYNWLEFEKLNNTPFHSVVEYDPYYRVLNPIDVGIPFLFHIK